MSKECDHKSVGILVWRNGNLLLIERKKLPFGFAPPAGHLDADVSFEEAAKRELQEEVGLKAENIKLIIEGRRNNPCRRNGDWHYWKIYEAEAEGEPQMNEDEVKQIKFVDKELLVKLAEKTKQYLRQEISDDEWEKSPGLEPVWYDWLKSLKII